MTVSKPSISPDPTNASPIHFTAIFSVPVTGFSASGVTLGGTAYPSSDTVTGSGTTYDVAVSGMTSSGTVSISLNAGAGHDSAGNLSVPSTSTDNVVSFSTGSATISITEFTVPTSASNPYQIVTGPDGNLWFTEEGAAKIGRITTAGIITEFTAGITARQ